MRARLVVIGCVALVACAAAAPTGGLGPATPAPGPEAPTERAADAAAADDAGAGVGEHEARVRFDDRAILERLARAGAEEADASAPPTEGALGREATSCTVPGYRCNAHADCGRLARAGCIVRCVHPPTMPVVGHPNAPRPPGRCQAFAGPPCEDRPWSVDAQGHRHYRAECLE